jgi:hypothetical protein
MVKVLRHFRFIKLPDLLAQLQDRMMEGGVFREIMSFFQQSLPVPPRAPSATVRCQLSPSSFLPLLRERGQRALLRLRGLRRSAFLLRSLSSSAAANVVLGEIRSSIANKRIMEGLEGAGRELVQDVQSDFQELLQYSLDILSTPSVEPMPENVSYGRC